MGGGHPKWPNGLGVCLCTHIDCFRFIGTFEPRVYSMWDYRLACLGWSMWTYPPASNSIDFLFVLDLDTTKTTDKVLLRGSIKLDVKPSLRLLANIRYTF